MSSVTLFLATAAASEELSPVPFKLAAACFILAGLCVLISGGLKLFLEHKHRLGAGIAAVGVVLALVEFSFAWYVRHIDFQPVTAEGTPTSPTLLKALFVPFMPLLLNAALLLAHRRHGAVPPEK